jgi:hypothetical protein
MSVWSTQPLTEMSTRSIPGGWGKGRTAFKADNVAVVYESTVYKMWDPRRLTTLWASMVCSMGSFTYLPYLYIYYWLI